MKRITFLAITAVLLNIGAAKAQVGVHVGLNFGTPAYYQPYYPYQRVVVATPPPVYYGPTYYSPAYYPRYYRRPVYIREGYYPGRVYYHNRYYDRPYRRW